MIITKLNKTTILLIGILLIFPIAIFAQSATDEIIDSLPTDTLVSDSSMDASPDTALAVGLDTEAVDEEVIEDDPLFKLYRLPVLVFILIFSGAVLLYTTWARDGKELFIRKIPGIAAIEEAVGRATEMGKPVLFIPGISDVEDIETIAGLSILGRVAKITATYDTPLSVPVRYPMIMAAGQEVVEQAYIEAGKHDAYDRDTVKYVAGEQFAFTATVNGWMMREKPAANIYMGAFFAESLLLAETGNAAGSIQIAGTARPEQLPFFIAACDYTLMGEELYAASSYLSREPLLLGGIKGQDFVKVIIIICILIGIVLVSFNIGDWFVNIFRVM